MTLHGLRQRGRRHRHRPRRGAATEPAEGWPFAAASLLAGLAMLVGGVLTIPGHGASAFFVMLCAFGLALIIAPLIAVTALLPERYTRAPKVLIGAEIALITVVLLDLPVLFVTMLA